MPGQGNYWDYLILGRVLRPHQGDTVSPRRGLNDTGDILDICPDAAPYFLQMGMHCLGCPASRGETVEQACAVHGVDTDDLLEQINALIRK